VMTRPSPHNVLRTLVLMQPDISTEKLQAELAAFDIHLSNFAVGQFRMSFLAVLKLLRSNGLLRNKVVVAPDWLTEHRRSRRRHNGHQPQAERCSTRRSIEKQPCARKRRDVAKHKRRPPLPKPTGRPWKPWDIN